MTIANKPIDNLDNFLEFQHFWFI